MTSLPWIDPDELRFPDPRTALTDPDGLLAFGGDLSPERLLLAYRSGIFPWFSDDQPILWWSPDPRCVLFPEEVHISRSLRRTLNSNEFRFSIDTAFDAVLDCCADTRAEGTWITPGMKRAYSQLHRLGAAHSAEIWDQNDVLVGGLYGVAIGQCFFGESMFSTATNASRIAMVYLARHLRLWGYRLMDCQVESGHLLRMGARSIPREEFLSIIDEGAEASPGPSAWTVSWHWSGRSPK